MKPSPEALAAASDTPRTDALLNRGYHQTDCDLQWKDFIAHARQLERELNDARQMLDTQSDVINALKQGYRKIYGQRDQWKQCADELAECYRLELAGFLNNGKQDDIDLFVRGERARAKVNQLKG